MFDFGFWEIAIIGVIILVVVGPEKMPALARKAGTYFGKATKFMNKIKREIKDELNADELKKQLSLNDKDSTLSDVIKEAKSSLDDIKKEGAGIKDVFEHTRKDSTTEKASTTEKTSDFSLENYITNGPTNKDKDSQ